VKIFALAAVVSAFWTATARALPPVTGGKVSKPYLAAVAGRPMICEIHVYKDGLIARCLYLKGAA
jgi:hypothetical protein